MQRVELTDGEGLNIHCPFCGSLILSEEKTLYCEHTLFIATDEGGFEYLNPKLSIQKEADLGDKSMDEFTNEIEYPDSIKFAIYQPAPSFFGVYIGFANE